MPSFTLQSTLTPEERAAKRKLILHDTASLFTLLAITAVLFTATLFLFRSFSAQRALLAKRWLSRGEAALQHGRPDQAVEALRSALAYAPGQRNIEIELAQALAASGRTQEATAYFNALWEAEPGNGTINLALARLAAEQGDREASLKYYRASIYGNWEGDGTQRRRDVRLELAQYLLSLKKDDLARSELLIAAGNAPDDPAIKLRIASLMETAADPANASQIYKSILQHRPPNLAALEGAGRTALALGYFAQARDYLERALNHPESQREPEASRQTVRNVLADAIHALLLYPSGTLSPLAQAQRVLHDSRLAESRFTDCTMSQPSLATQPEIVALMTRWQQAANKLTVPQLQRSVDLRDTTMQLVYDTETIANHHCGNPTGDNLLLSKIAGNPGAVEAE